MFEKAILHIEAAESRGKGAISFVERKLQAMERMEKEESVVQEINVIEEVDHIRRRFGIDRIMCATSMNDMVVALAS